MLIGYAESQQKRGNHAKEKPLAERALAIQEKALPPGHPDLADTLETLAEIYAGRGGVKRLTDTLLGRKLSVRSCLPQSEKAEGDHIVSVT